MKRKGSHKGRDGGLSMGTKRQATAPKPNAFESFQKRQKFNIIGRQVRGNVIKPGESRAKGISGRQAHLLKELNTLDKSNTFVDKRFGERDSDMSEDQKMLERFARERTRTLSKGTKGSRFNLQDDLTHGGVSLADESAIGAMDQPMGSDSEDEGVDRDGRVDRRTVALEHFGGGGDLFDRVRAMDANKDDTKERNKDKSSKEVYDEIIKKSKLFKMERQEAKEDNVNLINDLDEDFSAIRALMEYKGKDDVAESNELVDDFVLAGKQLADDARAKASDRLKTGDEIAKEEKERLEKLEAERLARMEGASAKDSREQAKQKAAPTDDDLDANFVLDDEFKTVSDEEEDEDEAEDEAEADLGGYSSKKARRIARKAADDVVVEGAGALDAEDEEDEEDEDEEEEEEEEDEAEPEAKRKAAAPVEGDLPFTFEAPKTLKEFRSLLKNRSPVDQATIIQRIMTCNHISLGPENRPKMQRFYVILLDYFRHLCLAASAVSESQVQDQAAALSDSVARALQGLDMLCRPLVELTEQMPRYAAGVHRERLSSVRQNMLQRLAQWSPDEEEEEEEEKEQGEMKPSYFPSADELLYMKLISIIYPVSDFRHNVTVPAMVLMGEFLTRLPVCGPRDIAAALVLCQLLLHYTALSKRHIPEMLTFLHAMLLAGFKGPVAAKALSSTTVPALGTFLPGCAIWSDLASESKSTSTSSSNSTTASHPKLPLTSIFITSNNHSALQSPAFRLSCLSTVMQLVKNSVEQWSAAPSLPEMFDQLHRFLSNLHLSTPESSTESETLVSLEQTRAELVQALAHATQKCVASRRPLFRMARATSIKQFAPIFNENFQPGKDTDPNKERAETKRLEKKLKREKKGALRELRRDTAFIQSEKRKQQEYQEQERRQKSKEIKSWLESQQRDTNILRGKTKLAEDKAKRASRKHKSRK